MEPSQNKLIENLIAQSKQAEIWSSQTSRQGFPFEPSDFPLKERMSWLSDGVMLMS